eukprot:UN28492
MVDFEEGNWMVHQSGQPCFIKKLIKRSASTGRGGGLFAIDYRVMLPYVEAWDKFADVDGNKKMKTFKNPSDDNTSEYPLLKIKSKNDKEVILSVLGEDNEPLELKIFADRKK